MGGRTITLCACALALPVPAAVAQDRPDPDSPAGVEYELPLEGARRDASGDSDRKGARQNSERSPLFGKGISKGGTPAGAQPAEENGDNAPSDSPGGSGRQSAGSPAAEPPRPARLAASAADDGDDTGLLLGALAATVLLGGAGLGLLLRRGLGRSQGS